MKTKITDLLKIEYPIIQGAMAYVSDSALASAVSNAGGLGTIASGGRTADWLRDEIQKTKDLTNKPFAVNLMLMAKNVDELVEVIIDEKVPVVTLGAGNPVPLLPKFKENNIKTIAVVPNTKLAKRVEENGADAIVIEGMEAGGHIGSLTTMALMTQVIPEVKIPVIVAGGISDGRGLAATLVMGASGVQIGTRFYAAKETNVHINSKQAIIDASDVDTVIIGSTIKKAMRGLKNEFTDLYLSSENNKSPEELLNLIIGTNRKASELGDVQNGFVMAGQSLSPIKSIQSSKEIIDEIVSDAQKALENLKF